MITVAPKKYIKVDGRMKLNPEYVAHMNAEREKEDAEVVVSSSDPVSTAPCEEEPFTVVYSEDAASEDNVGAASESDSEEEQDQQAQAQTHNTAKPPGAIGQHASVAGGIRNKAKGGFSVVGGGHDNKALAPKTTIGGGCQNKASKPKATVSGGNKNTASGPDATVSGGGNNAASSPGATVSGGLKNAASGNLAVVGGGRENVASNRLATVCGGVRNEALGEFSAIAGGRDNTAGGKFAVVVGGDHNAATGNFSVAMGCKAEAKHNRSCVINLSNGTAESSSNGEFQVRANAFAISIDGTTVTVDKKNIQAYANLLNLVGALQTKLAKQEEQIQTMQKQIERLS